MADYQIGKGSPSQYGELIDFGNMVFREDFKALLPKFYDNHPETAADHYVIEKNGKVRAMVGSFPLTLHVNGEVLSMRGIGTVSAHPYDRGKGYMSKLMPLAVREAQEEGTALMVLSGMRQRYERFGFAVCGTIVQFAMIPENRRHCRAISTDGIALLPLAENPEYLPACSALHDHQPLHAQRREEHFLEIARSWNACVYVLLQNECFAGYCCMNSEGMIQELVLTDKEMTLPVAMKLLEQENKGLTFSVPFYKTKMIEEFMKAAEGFHLFSGPNFQVLDYPRVIKAFLGLKAGVTELERGSLVVEVQGMGRYEICVSQQNVTVEGTAKKADVSLPPLEMMRYLFAPESRFLHRASHNPQVRSWFPIPLFFPQQDNC